MDKIVRETNMYASTPNAAGRTHSHPNWEQFIVGGLKALLALALYMAMKKQPNYIIY